MEVSVLESCMVTFELEEAWSLEEECVFLCLLVALEGPDPEKLLLLFCFWTGRIASACAMSASIEVLLQVNFTLQGKKKHESKWLNSPSKNAYLLFCPL